MANGADGANWIKMLTVQFNYAVCLHNCGSLL